jgi:hypothetical protein
VSINFRSWSVAGLPAAGPQCPVLKAERTRTDGVAMSARDPGCVKTQKSKRDEE